jgi:hypothetical protein
MGRGNILERVRREKEMKPERGEIDVDGVGLAVGG